MSTDSRQEEAGRPPSFETRFNVEVGIEEAQRRFMNTCFNVLPRIVRALCPGQGDIEGTVATLLGEQYFEGISGTGIFSIRSWLTRDFNTCLRTVEKIDEAIQDANAKGVFSEAVEQCLALCEIDLGVRWANGVFWPSGAKLLDDELVNDQLKWLSDAGYPAVREPFEKGLSDFLRARNEAERYKDVVTDMYEALEAMAKIVCGNGKDLSANREAFVTRLGLTKNFDKMLKEYVDFGCEFRHAEGPRAARTPLLPQEVEAFVYMTGLFLRLAIERLRTSNVAR